MCRRRWAIVLALILPAAPAWGETPSLTGEAAAVRVRLNGAFSEADWRVEPVRSVRVEVADDGRSALVVGPEGTYQVTAFWVDWEARTKGVVVRSFAIGGGDPAPQPGPQPNPDPLPPTPGPTPPPDPEPVSPGVAIVRDMVASVAPYPGKAEKKEKLAAVYAGLAVDISKAVAGVPGFEPLREPQAIVNRTRVWVQEILGGDTEHWRPFFDRLRQHHNTIRFEGPGDYIGVFQDAAAGLRAAPH